MHDAGTTWDNYGQLVMVLMFMAMIAYVAPGAMTLSPTARYWFQIAASSLLGIAIILAVAVSIVWFAA